ncbi:MAG: aminoacyl-tRNA hydrolase [Oscillospiraceae bacterium]|nr:aminoacyl-tRNA hydrolase [Bacillota bacterium]
MLFSKPSADWLIVGLGNPGRQYDRTRHNAGFRAMEALARRLGCPLDRVKFQGRMGQCAHGGQKLVLLLPQTFMNLSGNAVAEAVRFYRLPPERVLVLCDDISLEPGRLRVRGSGSAGGHNGLKSIIARLGSQDFPRVKIGVGAKPHPDYDLADWVLSTFSQQEEKALAPIWDQAGEAALAVLTLGVEQAASRFNGVGK